jgi:hypothetical protein
VVNVKTLNGSERDLFFALKGKILMRHTHDTAFSERILDFYKILEDIEIFHFIFKEN